MYLAASVKTVLVHLERMVGKACSWQLCLVGDLGDDRMTNNHIQNFTFKVPSFEDFQLFLYVLHLFHLCFSPGQIAMHYQ